MIEKCGTVNRRFLRDAQQYSSTAAQQLSSTADKLISERAEEKKNGNAENRFALLSYRKKKSNTKRKGKEKKAMQKHQTLALSFDLKRCSQESCCTKPFAHYCHKINQQRYQTTFETFHSFHPETSGKIGRKFPQNNTWPCLKTCKPVVYV